MGYHRFRDEQLAVPIEEGVSNKNINIRYQEFQ
ncbi:Uncharacterised protein [Lederbergia lenta]|uniref:Uncharacterized protein n=1 Tax=Lederbergia lenta TaxID=1467 RepID=A0A2X4ZBW8_LEDLE|nr:Uncharacterised protein [Lederbergia lenta]